LSRWIASTILRISVPFMTWCLVVLCGVKKKREQCPTFQSRQKICRTPFRCPSTNAKCTSTHREALWKTGKWSKTYILSISGSSKAVQDLTNSKLPRKNRMTAGKLPTVLLFSQGCYGKLLAFVETVKHRGPSECLVLPQR
jgi:hypothetical protein